MVTLHNQRDFLFFRRHRYAFRSTEKAALQEIGPRFTLKLRWLKKGLPSVGGAFGAGEHPPGLEVDVGSGDGETDGTKEDGQATSSSEVELPKGGQEEYEWMWKVRKRLIGCSATTDIMQQPELETSRRTFFL